MSSVREGSGNWEAKCSMIIPDNYPYRNYQYISKSVVIYNRLSHTFLDSRFDFENLTQSEARELTANKWQQKCDGGPYNGADSVHCPLLYMYNGKTSITKQQNDGILLLDGQTLSNSRFDFENLAQSEARELPTSGCASVMEGPTMVLIMFIALYYTYKMAKHQ